MSKLISALFSASLLVSVACGSAPKSSYKNIIVPDNTCVKYHINIDYGFDEVQSLAIMNAWNVWANVLGDKMSYDVSRSTYVNDQVTKCTIQVQHKDPPEGYDGFCSYGWFDTGKTMGATIVIREPMDRARLDAVAIHEFGHALGLDHDENPNSIMHFDAPVPIPSCKDYQNVCAIWSCSVDCLSTK